MTGKKIDLPTKDGVIDAYVSHPDGAGSWPAVLFFMDGGGLRQGMFQMADRLAASGYFVVMPNMYWREGSYPSFDPMTVFSNPPERERLMKIVGRVTPENSMADAQVALDFLAKEPKVKRGDRVACTGYCLGGGLSMMAACHFPERIVAAASFHGGRFLTSPQAPEELAKKARARLFIGVAEADAQHTSEVSAKLTAALHEAKLHFAIEYFAGSKHGWTVPDMPVFNAPAAEQHWDRLGRLLNETIGKEG